MTADQGGVSQHPEELQRAVEKLGPWFHNLHLPHGVQTAPDHFLGDFPSCLWQAIAGQLPDDLAGWSVLDIGCNAGFYSVELARRGARVEAIDVNATYLEQARWVAAQFGLSDRISFRRMQIYDLAGESGRYDLVLFLGVFYHLRYPLLGLDIVSEKVGKMLIFQTLMLPGETRAVSDPDVSIHAREVMLQDGWPKMAFIEHRLANDPTNWWAINLPGAEALLRSSGLRVTARPGREVFICEPDSEHPSCVATWDKAELDAASGRNSHARSQE